MEDKLKKASQHNQEQGTTTSDYHAPDGTPLVSPPPLQRKMLTITLTDRAPVRICVDEWGILARADAHDGGQVECQANRKWKLIVRQHDDGRAIVYGIYDTNWQNAHGRRGGQLVAAGGDIAAAIKSVGASLDFGEELIQECIADLPADDL